MKTGTLKELNVKPGDVVGCVYSSANTKCGAQYIVNEYRDIEHYREGNTNESKFRIISRADDTPTLWRDMTPEEKGALLLAHHEGKVIEAKRGATQWCTLRVSPRWIEDQAYRIKPEPKVEIVKLYGDLDRSWNANYRRSDDSYSVTLTFRDGKVDPVAQVKPL